MTKQQKDEVMFNLIREMLKHQEEEDRLLQTKSKRAREPLITQIKIKIKSLFKVLPTDHF